MVITGQLGILATCPASQPIVPDFSWGFQPSFSSGTRSSVLRVLAISRSNSGSSASLSPMGSSAEFGCSRPGNGRRTKSECQEKSGADSGQFRIAGDTSTIMPRLEIEICSFLHGSSFPRCLRYRLALLAVDPKLEKRNGDSRVPRSVHTSFVRAEAFESFGDTGSAQSSQIVRMKTEVIHH